MNEVLRVDSVWIWDKTIKILITVRMQKTIHYFEPSAEYLKKLSTDYDEIFGEQTSEQESHS